MEQEKIYIPVEGDLSELKKQMQSVEQSIGNLNIGATLTKKMETSLKNVFKQIETYQRNLEKGLTGDPKAAQQLSKAYSKVSTVLGTIQRDIDKMNPARMFDEADIVAIKEFASEIDKLKAQKITLRTEGVQELLAVNKEVADAVKNIGKIDPEQIVSADKLTAQLKERLSVLQQEEGHYTRQLASVEALYKAVERLELDKSTNGASFASTLNAHTSTLLPDNFSSLDFDEMKVALQDAALDAHIFSESLKLDGRQEDINKLTGALQNINAAASAANPNIQKIETEITRVANQMDNTKRAATDMVQQGINQAAISADAARTALINLGGATQQAQNTFNTLGASSSNAAQNMVNRFLGTQAIFNTITNQLRKAAQEIRNIDDAITQIAIVTDFSNSDLWKQIDTYTGMAKQYGTTIKGVYEVSQLYYQQGLQTNQVMNLTAETLQFAKIANLDYATATDYMTVAIRGFKLEFTDASTVVDVYSKLAAIAAVDTNELGTAMSKVAAIAESAGMSIQSTSTFLTQIIETTRESPEVAGSALKSIIARFSQLKMNPNDIIDLDGEAVSVNQVDKALKAASVNLLDVTGNFRDLDDVIFELAGKWDGLDKNTQRYVATMAGGTMQQSRFLALMSDSTRLVELQAAAMDSEDAGLLQFAATLDSLETKMNKISTGFQDFYLDVFNGPVIGAALDAVGGFLNWLNKIPTVLGGTVLVAFVVFAKKIANNFSDGLVQGYLKAKAQIEAQPVNIQTSNGGFSNVNNLSGMNKLTTGWKMFKNNGVEAFDAVGNSAGKFGNTIQGAGMMAGAAIGTISKIAMVIGIITTVIGVVTSLLKALGAIPKTVEELQELEQTAKIAAAQERDNAKGLAASIKKYQELERTQANNVEARQEFLDLNNELADKYPELIARIDDEGNAIISLAKAYEVLDREKEESLKADADYYKAAIKTQKAVIKDNQEVSGMGFIDNQKYTDFKWDSKEGGTPEQYARKEEQRVIENQMREQARTQAEQRIRGYSNAAISTATRTSMLGAEKGMFEADFDYANEAINSYVQKMFSKWETANPNFDVNDYIDSEAFAQDYAQAVEKFQEEATDLSLKSNKDVFATMQDYINSPNNFSVKMVDGLIEHLRYLGFNDHADMIQEKADKLNKATTDDLVGVFKKIEGITLLPEDKIQETLKTIPSIFADGVEKQALSLENMAKAALKKDDDGKSLAQIQAIATAWSNMLLDMSSMPVEQAQKLQQILDSGDITSIDDINKMMEQIESITDDTVREVLLGAFSKYKDVALENITSANSSNITTFISDAASAKEKMEKALAKDGKLEYLDMVELVNSGLFDWSDFDVKARRFKDIKKVWQAYLGSFEGKAEELYAYLDNALTAETMDETEYNTLKDLVAGMSDSLDETGTTIVQDVTRKIIDSFDGFDFGEKILDKDIFNELKVHLNDEQLAKFTETLDGMEFGGTTAEFIEAIYDILINQLGLDEAYSKKMVIQKSAALRKAQENDVNNATKMQELYGKATSGTATADEIHTIESLTGKQFTAQMQADGGWRIMDAALHQYIADFMRAQGGALVEQEIALMSRPMEDGGQAMADLFVKGFTENLTANEAAQVMKEFGLSATDFTKTADNSYIITSKTATQMTMKYAFSMEKLTEELKAGNGSLEEYNKQLKVYKALTRNAESFKFFSDANGLKDATEGVRTFMQEFSSAAAALAEASKGSAVDVDQAMQLYSAAEAALVAQFGRGSQEVMAFYETMNKGMKYVYDSTGKLGVEMSKQAIDTVTGALDDMSKAQANARIAQIDAQIQALEAMKKMQDALRGLSSDDVKAEFGITFVGSNGKEWSGDQIADFLDQIPEDYYQQISIMAEIAGLSMENLDEVIALIQTLIVNDPAFRQIAIDAGIIDIQTDRVIIDDPAALYKMVAEAYNETVAGKANPMPVEMPADVNMTLGTLNTGDLNEDVKQSLVTGRQVSTETTNESDSGASQAADSGVTSLENLKTATDNLAESAENVTTLYQGLETTLGNTAESASTIESSFGSMSENNVFTQLSDAADTFATNTTTSVEGLETTSNSVLERIKTAFSNAFSNILTTVQDYISRIQSSIDSLTDKTVTITTYQDTYYRDYGSPSSGSSSSSSSGTSGTQRASGGAIKKAGKALVGELGAETLLRNGKFQIIGANGAEFIKVQPGDQIIPNNDTDKLLKGKGGVDLSGFSFANGAMSGESYAGGTGIDAAIAALRQERKMWEALLSTNLSDLVKQMGAGRGGGGGSAKENKQYMLQLERWFNYLRRIESIENKITLLRAKRQNLKDGKKYAQSLMTENGYLQQQNTITAQLIKEQKKFRESLKAEYLQKYGKYISFVGDAMQINAQAILEDTENNEELGEMLEEIMKEWEEVTNNITENTQSLEDNQAQMEENNQELRNMYMDVENELLAAIQNNYQQVIDMKQKEVEDKEKLDNQYIDSLRKSLQRERDMRNKANNQADREQLQRRIALLSRDTSGKSDKELASLRKQLADLQEDEYFSNREAAINDIEEAAQTQRDIMQAEVDLLIETNELKLANMQLYWAEVDNIMSQGTEAVLGYLTSFSQEYLDGSAMMREEYKDGWEFTIDAALEYMSGAAQQIADQIIQENNRIAENLSAPAVQGNSSSSSGGSGGGSSSSSSSSSSSGGGSSSSGSNLQHTTFTYNGTKYSHYISPATAEAKIMSLYNEEMKRTHGRVDMIQNAARHKNAALASRSTGRHTAGYEKGGIIDYTGLAMVHGGKGPGEQELVLDRVSTPHFIKFVEWIMGLNQENMIPEIKVPKIEEKDTGTTIGEINITVETGVVQSQNDANMVADTVMDKLIQISQYQGNTAIFRRR